MARVKAVDKILSLSMQEINRMGRKELAKAVGVMRDAIHKRYERLSKTYMGVESPAYKKIMEMGKISTKGKDVNALRNEFKKARSVLILKTSTVKGWEKTREKTYKRIGRFTDEESEKRFWKAYREIEKNEDSDALMQSYGSDQTQRYLKSVMNRTGSLSETEKEKYKELFPGDTTDLDSLNETDTAVIRTLIEMGEYYEEQEISQNRGD